MALNTSGVFAIEDLPEEIQTSKKNRPQPSKGPWLTLAEMEERHIPDVIEATNGNISRAAEILGVDRHTLYRRMDRSSEE